MADAGRVLPMARPGRPVAVQGDAGVPVALILPDGVIRLTGRASEDEVSVRIWALVERRLSEYLGR